MAKQASGFSWRAADATEGGGINGALAKIEKIGFVQEFNYGGRFRDKPSAAIVVKYDPGFEWNEENYPIGPSDSWKVSKDGKSCTPIAGQKALNKGSVGFLFIDALEKAAEAAGEDIEDLLPVEDDGTLTIDGLEDRQVRLAQVDYKTAGGDSKQKVVIGALVVNGPTSRANGKAKASSEDVEEKTADAIRALLEEDSRIKFNDLGNLVFDAHRKDADAKQMMKLAMTESFVAGLDGVEFDKKKGVLTAADND